VLQFIVEWLIQRGQPIKAFTFFEKFASERRGNITCKFIRLWLDRGLSIVASTGVYCGKAGLSEKCSTHHVRQLMEEEDKQRIIEGEIRKALQLEIQIIEGLRKGEQDINGRLLVNIRKLS
jgi:hypothetical protein